MPEHFDMALFVERLQARRLARGLSQTDLALAAGTSQSWICRLEHGAAGHVRSDTLFALCRALEVSADYLLGLSDSQEPGHHVTIVLKSERPQALGTEGRR